VPRPHAAAAEAHCLAPAGRFEELIDVTPRVLDVVREEGGRLCQTGAVGLAGRALALYERGELAAAEALELFEGAPSPQSVVHFDWLAIDMLRPLAGPQRTRQTAARVHRAGTTLAGRVYELRLNLQLGALLGEWSTLPGLIAEARALASPACAPPLAWTADWAQAVQRAASGEGTRLSPTRGAPPRSWSATESHTPRPGCSPTCCRSWTRICAPLAERVAAFLDAMGAVTSAMEAAAHG
jgi:hypothetical protein